MSSTADHEEPTLHDISSREISTRQTYTLWNSLISSILNSSTSPLHQYDEDDAGNDIASGTCRARPAAAVYSFEDQG